MSGRERWTTRAAEGDVVALARLLVAVPSVNPELSTDGDGEAEIASVCAALLEGWGFDTERKEVAPGRWNVVARRAGDRGPTLLLNGHLDTVGVEGMTAPFDPVIEDGRLRGRGACDMKGGVASILAASAALARSGRPERGRLVVALTADEEHASLGMRSLVAEGIAADAGIVCEPTGLAVMPAHKGFLWLDVRFRGVAAHGSRPDVGADAVRHAARYLASLEQHHRTLEEAPAHPLLGRPSFHIGTIEGGTAPSVYPHSCRVVIERRTLPGEETGAVVEPFRTCLEECPVPPRGLEPELTVSLERGGSDVDPDAPVVAGLLDALRAEGVPPRVEGMTAWVDAAFLNDAGIPSVCFGPGSIAQAHGADEWVEVEQLRVCARVLERYARRFLDDESV